MRCILPALTTVNRNQGIFPDIFKLFDSHRRKLEKRDDDVIRGR